MSERGKLIAACVLVGIVDWVAWGYMPLIAILILQFSALPLFYSVLRSTDV